MSVEAGAEGAIRPRTVGDAFTQRTRAGVACQELAK